MLTEDDTEMFIIFISPLTFLQFHANNEDKIKEMPWGREGVPHTHCLCARNPLVIFLMKASPYGKWRNWALPCRAVQRCKQHIWLKHVSSLCWNPVTNLISSHLIVQCTASLMGAPFQMCVLECFVTGAVHVDSLVTAAVNHAVQRHSNAQMEVEG